MIKELRVAVKGWVRDVGRNPANQQIQILGPGPWPHRRPAGSGVCSPALSSDFSASRLPSLDKTPGAPSGSGHLLGSPSSAPPSLLPQPVPVVEPVQGGFGLFCLLRSCILRTAPQEVYPQDRPSGVVSSGPPLRSCILRTAPQELYPQDRSSGVVSLGPLQDLEHRCPLRTILPQCSRDGESVPQPEFGKHLTRAPGSARVVGVRLALRVWGAGNPQRDSPWDPLVMSPVSNILGSMLARPCGHLIWSQRNVNTREAQVP